MVRCYRMAPARIARIAADAGVNVEEARRVLGGQIRIGRPLGVAGLPESAKNPGFAASVGLLIYPQLSGAEFFEPSRGGQGGASQPESYFGRVGRWLKESF